MPPPGAVQPLPELWRAWTRIIGRLARRAGSGLRLNSEEYETLHRALLALCDEHAATDESYRQLGEVVRPWVTLQVLQMTDRELLVGLYAQCWRIDRDLHGGHGLRAERARWVTPSTAFLALVVSLVAVGALTGLYVWVSEQLNVGGYFLRLWWVRRTTAELVFIGAVVVVGVVWVLLSRTRRS